MRYFCKIFNHSDEGKALRPIEGKRTYIFLMGILRDESILLSALALVHFMAVVTLAGKEL